MYHHYRAQGWVVRSGYQLGSDWALYKMGPQHFHATYTLAVQVELWGIYCYYCYFPGGGEEDWGGDRVPPILETGVGWA